MSTMYYNENTLIYFNGAFIKATEAKGNVFDQSLHYGYAVFEGIRSYDTKKGVRIFEAQAHFDRMQNSCNAVKIPYPYKNEELIEISYRLLEMNHLKNAYLRPLVSVPPNMSLTTAKQSQLMIAAWEWPALLGNKLLRVMTSSYRRITPASFKVAAKVSGHYVNSILASHEARDEGYDEALLLDVNGFIAEGPGANFFMEKNNTLYTPQLGSILPGITRATVIALCKQRRIPLIEKQILPEEVYQADSAFYCGTAAEIIGLGSLDHHYFAKPWEDSLGNEIHKAYQKLVLENSYSAELLAS
ncbi:MAG: branched-chain amino acid transaminase [Flavisolibacter sp.]